MQGWTWRRAGRLGLAAALAGLVTAGDAHAQETGAGHPGFLDDRSSPEALVRSLYNAVERREYSRAYGYFGEESGQPDFQTFAKGYETTASVRVKIGGAREEGAAGSVYALVPVVLEAKDRSGDVTVFRGCYETRMVQAANQDQPPYRPRHIERARMSAVSEPFEAVTPACPETLE